MEQEYDIENKEVKSKEDLLIESLEKQTLENKAIRDQAIDKIVQAISKTNIADEANAKMLSAKLEMFSTLNALLDSNTKDANVITKTVMTKKTVDANEEVAKYTVAILKNISLTNVVDTPIIKEDQEEDMDKILDSIDTPPIKEEEKNL